MLSAEEIYEIARKFVFDEKLTIREEQIKEEILNNRSYYIQYCAGVALLDMMERKGEYEPDISSAVFRVENKRPKRLKFTNRWEKGSKGSEI